MIIVNVKTLEDCLDELSIREYELDAEITEPFIRHLSTLGTLQYYPDFARPFFSVVALDQYTLKGVQQSRTVRAYVYGEEVRKRDSETLIVNALTAFQNR